MATRLWILGILAVLLSTMPGQAASVRTPNFLVEAPNQELALEFGRLAERYRKEKAIEWLGQEMPRWGAPCPLRVTVTMSGAKGATQFEFPNGQVMQTMVIEGPLDRLRYSVLPHEITHTVLAHQFRHPVPRWADEGGSVYSEDELERTRHDQMCKQILNAGRAFPLRRLFSLPDYPKDVMVLYAEGYSVSKYLIEQSDRRTFLAFVGHGMQFGWDDAVKTYYQHRNVDELEQAWLDSFRKRPSAVAKATNSSDTRLVVRQSLPPAQPVLDPNPVSRGVPPVAGREGDRFGEISPSKITNRPKAARLGEPVPMEPGQIVLSPAPSNASPASRPRTSPPPVILFPSEPLPLRY